MAVAITAATLGLANAAAARGGAAPDCAAPVTVPPAEAVPYARLDPSGPGEYVQLNFPEKAGGNRARLHYLLKGGQDLGFDVQLGLGTNARTLPQTIRGAVLVDGRQTRVRAGGIRPAVGFEATIAAPDRVSRMQLTVAAADIRPGAHTVSLLLWKDGRGDFPGLAFTVLKDRGCFAPTVASVGAGRLEAGSSKTSWVRDQVSQRLVDCRQVIARPDQRGNLSLQVHLALPVSSHMRPEDRSTVAVVALLDGVQTDVGTLGQAPRAVLGQDQVADLEARFSGLPRDGRPHALLVYALTGEGQPSWDPRTGGRAAWARSPVCLAQARW